MIVGGFPPNKLALHSFGGKPFKFAALCAVHSTGAVGTTRAALMAAPVNLAGIRDQLHCTQKGRVFDSREAFVTAVPKPSCAPAMWRSTVRAIPVRYGSPPWSQGAASGHTKRRLPVCCTCRLQRGQMGGVQVDVEQNVRQ